MNVLALIQTGPAQLPPRHQGMTNDDLSCASERAQGNSAQGPFSSASEVFIVTYATARHHEGER